MTYDIQQGGSLFAAAVPGSEPAVRMELQELQQQDTQTQAQVQTGDAAPAALIKDLQDVAGGVAFRLQGPASAEWFRAAAGQLAGQMLTPTRLLQRLGEFPVSRFAELIRKTANLNWQEILLPGEDFRVRATCHRSKLYHSAAVEQRVRSGIQERLGSTAGGAAGSTTEAGSTAEAAAGSAGSEHSTHNAGAAAALIVVRIDNNHCTISRTVGNPELFRRGYRLETAKAPLRENLAAVLLQLSGWQGTEPLIDPFCGSGTIAIEAALLARRRGSRPPRIYASDRDAGACRAATANAERAGVAEHLQIHCHAISDLSRWSDTRNDDRSDARNNSGAPLGHIITNPPYGKRVRSRTDLRNLYARFGTVLREGFPGWKITLLCTAGPEGDILTGQMGIPLTVQATFSNGGLPVAVRSGRIPPAQ